MWKRYVIPCAVVMVLALGVAVVTYRLSAVSYLATCTFQVSLPVTSQQNNPATLDFQIKASANEVRQVVRSDIFSAPAKAVGVDPGTVAGEFAYSQVENSPQFLATVVDSEPDRAADLANRICDELVARVGASEQQARDAEISQLQKRISTLSQSIASIEATPVARRSPADQAFDEAQKKAIQSDQALIATTLALPPNNVSVMTRSPGGIRSDNRNLTRNVLVAAAAGLLACFLIILVGEIVREPRAASTTET